MRVLIDFQISGQDIYGFPVIHIIARHDCILPYHIPYLVRKAQKSGRVLVVNIRTYKWAFAVLVPFELPFDRLLAIPVLDRRRSRPQGNWGQYLPLWLGRHLSSPMGKCFGCRNTSCWLAEVSS
jgi:hypothetical protein